MNAADIAKKINDPSVYFATQAGNKFSQNSFRDKVTRNDIIKVNKINVLLYTLQYCFLKDNTRTLSESVK